MSFNLQKPNAGQKPSDYPAETAKILEFEDMEQEFFDEILGPLGGLDQNKELFDLADPAAKRKRFNSQRKQIFELLIQRDGKKCQLSWNPECTKVGTAVDHFIPLSSNILNKLKGVPAPKGKKVPATSYGSNHMNNLILACSNCNNAKKHRFPSKIQVSRIFRNRNNPEDIRFADLFNQTPGWGLRGDPYLWQELRDSLEFNPLPHDESSLVSILSDIFFKITNHRLEHSRPFHVEKLSHGGMSSGMIDPCWWMDNYVPFLIKKLESLNQVNSEK